MVTLEPSRHRARLELTNDHNGPWLHFLFLILSRRKPKGRAVWKTQPGVALFRCAVFHSSIHGGLGPPVNQPP